jgi:hypothetical protein
LQPRHHDGPGLSCKRIVVDRNFLLFKKISGSQDLICARRLLTAGMSSARLCNYQGLLWISVCELGKSSASATELASGLDPGSFCR